MFTLGMPFWQAVGGGGGPGYLFQETFTDTNGVLVASHTPDVAPVGFAWSNWYVPVGDSLEISSNTLVGVASTGTDRTASFYSASSSPAVAISPAYPYKVTFQAKASDLVNSSSSSFTLTDNSATYQVITLSLERRSASPNWRASIQYGGNLDGNSWVSAYFTPNAVVKLALLVEDGFLTFYQDDSIVYGPVACSMEAPTFDSLACYISYKTGDTSHIDLIEIEQL